MKLPLRAIHLIPVFSSQSALQRMRLAYDPLAEKIPPHITLVFPFESDLAPAALAHHLGEVTSSIAAFPVALGRPRLCDNGLIWLPVTEGREKVVSLHQHLYRGPLSVLQNLAIPYDPHVTIARVSSADREAALEAANRMTGPFFAEVDGLTVEEILPDESSLTESTICFGSAHSP